MRIYSRPDINVAYIEGVASGSTDQFSASLDGDLVSVFDKGRSIYQIKGLHYSQITNESNNGFSSAALTLSYLNVVFSVSVVTIDGYPNYSDKLKTLLAILAAHDRIANISYFDVGLRTQRIESVNFVSALYPDSEISKQVTYSDVDTIKQRILRIDISGGALGASTLSKVFDYSPEGFKQKLNGYHYEIS